jgi:molybdopterin molybdotransferase
MVQLASQEIARRWDDPTGMVGVDEARELILGAFQPLPAASLPIVDALGLVLAEVVVASSPVPPFANSAMDGFAVRSSDTRAVNATESVELRIVGEVSAGHPSRIRVEPGTAVRIMTGAPVPEGADAVVRFEETDEIENPRTSRNYKSHSVIIRHAARPGENVRPAGEDVAAGEPLLGVGALLRPAEIGVLAAIGRTHVAVHRRPVVAILSTGDEVVDPGQKLKAGQIFNSNSSTIAALVRRSGGEPLLLGVARDTTVALRARLNSARDSDLIITSGGVSTGDYDVVKHVLQMEGKVDLWQVRIKPGKPLAFGRIGGLPLLGLPGNPVAAAVAFEQFTRPAIRKLLGHRAFGIPTVQATLLDRVENRGGRRHYVRVRVEQDCDGRYVAHVAGSQGAGVLTSLMRGNGLLVIPEHFATAEPGAMFSVQMLDWTHD